MPRKASTYTSVNCLSVFSCLFTYSRTLLFWTWLIRSPCYFEGRSNSVGFALMFSVIYYQLFQTWLFWIPRYFELIVLSLHLKLTPLFWTCQKQLEYVHKSTAGNVLHFIWARTEHSKIFQCNSICWFIRHIIIIFIISVFFHTVLYFIKKWLIVT